MANERRRYFRINETIGIYYQALAKGEKHPEETQKHIDSTGIIISQDKKIDHLIHELADEHPKVCELMSLFNQKLGRAIEQMTYDNELMSRIAYKVKEANISACGIAFVNDEVMPLGSRLQIELQLLPSEKKIRTNGILVDVESMEEGHHYWRIDFYGMQKLTQEALIQHIVKRQNHQLAEHKSTI